MEGACMKAIAVSPRKPDSVHLAEFRRPSLDDVPGGRGVLVKVLRVGVDGTDKEINAGEYGAAPDGDDVLILRPRRVRPRRSRGAERDGTAAWRLCRGHRPPAGLEPL